jgi:hypothetical protein
MLAQALAMVRGDEHQRPCGLGARIDRLQHARQLTIDEGNLAVVGRAGEALGQIGRRLVGRVRVVVVDPEEPGRRARARRRRRAEKAQHRVSRGVGEPLDVRRAAWIVAPWQAIVVGLEATIEAESAIEGKGGDECGGPIAGLTKVFRRALHLR